MQDQLVLFQYLLHISWLVPIPSVNFTSYSLISKKVSPSHLWISHHILSYQRKVSPIKGIFGLPANLNKSFYYSLFEHLLLWLQHHHQELTCYEKIKLVLSMTHSNGYGRFANYCISVLEHGDLPTEPLMKGFHEWCISQYGTVDGDVVQFLSISCCAMPTSGLLNRHTHISWHTSLILATWQPMSWWQ